MAENGLIYFTADVDVAGTRLEGLFVIGDAEIGTDYCASNANSTGATTALSASGSRVPALNNLTLQATAMPPMAFGFFLASTTQNLVQNPGGSQGNLCLGGSIGRYVGPGQIQNTGPAGSFELALDLTAVPQPNGSVAVQPGETWNFQAWHRDTLPNMTPTSNFSNGYSIVFL